MGSRKSEGGRVRKKRKEERKQEDQEDLIKEEIKVK